MKHTNAFCLLAALVAPAWLMAQGPHIGLKAGMNLSTLYNTQVEDDQSRIGFNAGLMARTMPGEAFGLQAELLYSSKGNKTHYQALFGLIDQDVDFNLNYLELPVMAAIRFADGAFEVQAGGYAAYLLSANVSTSGDLGDGDEEVDRDNFKDMDAGLVGGVAFNAGPVQIGARYALGLMPIADGDASEELLGDAKNGCAQIYIAFGTTKE